MGENDVATPEEVAVFMANHAVVAACVYELYGDTSNPNTLAVMDAQAAMLLQANNWGRRQAAKELREWAETFGVGPTSEGIRAIVNEGADRIEKTISEEVNEDDD
jgi:hypothetical protein